MSKMHLVESASFPRSLYKNVTNEPQYEKLKEAAVGLSSSKNHLNESKAKKVLKEAKIDPNIQKKVLETLGNAGADVDSVELWQFPVSKVNTKDSPNLNGRVYGKRLWENVINDQSSVWQGGTGLANHPADEDDGDFMKQSIVWLDGFIGDDDIVYGIGTFVGEGGLLARQIIGVGGRIGFSTSGYGDFLSDGIEVDPETYEIERLADLVLNPSQGVFGDYNDAANSSKKKESVSKTNNNKLTESIVDSDEPMTLSEQLVFDHYKKAISENNKKTNALWEEKIEELETLTKKLKKENLSKDSKTKLNKFIEKTIENIMKDTRKAIEEGYAMRALCEDLDISDISQFKDIKNQLVDYNSLEGCLNQTSKELQKYKDLSDMNAEMYNDANLRNMDCSFRMEDLENEILRLKKEILDVRTENVNLLDQLEAMKNSNNELDNAVFDSESQIKNLENEIAVSNETNLDLRKTNKDLGNQINGLENSISDLKESRKTLSNNVADLSSKIESLTKTNQKLRSLLNDATITIKALKRKNIRDLTTIVASKASLLETKKALEGSRKRESNTMSSLQTLKRQNSVLKRNMGNIKNEAEDSRTSAIEARDIARKNWEIAQELKNNLEKETRVRRDLELEIEDRDELDYQNQLIAKAKEREEAKARREVQISLDKEREKIYDLDTMFRDNEAIDGYAQDYDIDEREVEDVKTLKDLESKVLFDSDVLSDEAEAERSMIRTPQDTLTLADLFN